MSKTTACVIGAGFVGGNLATTMAERGLSIYQFDLSGKRSPGVHSRVFLSTREMIWHATTDASFSGVVFVCVPSPMIQDTGECDTSIVESALRDLAIAANGKRQIIAVVKSTVPPGSCQRWNKMFARQGLSVCHSPEFLREASAKFDTETQSGRIVIGGDEVSREKVKHVFVAAFPDVPVYLTTSATSEMVKYFTNVQLATRLIMSCEFHELCGKLSAQGTNVDYSEMVNLAKVDSRLGGSHLNVPGHDGITGARGHCFPKDIAGLAYLAEKLGIKFSLVRAAQKKNLDIVSPEHRDWERMHGRAISKPKKKPIRFNVASLAKDYIARNGKPLFDKLLGS